MKTLSLEQMESISGGGSINACDVALGLAVAVWSTALAAASFGLAGFLVGWGGSALVGYVCHVND